MFASQLREAIREVTESQPLSNYGDNSGAGAAYLLLVVLEMVFLQAHLGLPLVMTTADLIAL